MFRNETNENYLYIISSFITFNLQGVTGEAFYLFAKI
jgi:hypothetical protein